MKVGMCVAAMGNFQLLLANGCAIIPNLCLWSGKIQSIPRLCTLLQYYRYVLSPVNSLLIPSSAMPFSTSCPSSFFL